MDQGSEEDRGGDREDMIRSTPFSVSIVLYKKAPAEFPALVDGILRAGPDIKLFLVDNSPDDALRKAIPSDERIEYIHNSRNTGYVAHNLGMQKSLDEGFVYHAVVNPDISLDPEIFVTLAAFMDANPDTGLLVPKVFFPDGRLQYVCRLLPTPADFFFRVFFPRNWVARRMKYYELRLSGYDSIMDVPYMSGCFLFLRNSTLREVGLFDERFFMYAEDIDLTRRIHAHSRSLFYPDVSITHSLGSGTYKSIKMFLITFMNISRYFNKYGWFFDRERKRTNRATLEQFRT